MRKFHYLCLLFFLSDNMIIFFGCASTEVQLQDNKIEPVIEKTISKNINITNEEYKKAFDKPNQSITDLYLLAMDRSEEIAVGTEDLFQAREKIRQAWGAVLPQLSFRTGLYGPNASATGGIFTQGFRFYARQNIMTGLTEFSGIKAGPLYENYSISQLQQQAAILYDQIAQIFFEYLLLEDSLNTQKILLENSTDLKNELEKRFYLGKIRRSEILNVDVVIAKTEALIINSHILLSEAQKKIRSLTGLEKDFVPEKPDYKNNFKTESYPENFLDQRTNMEKRPDIMALKTAWELAKVATINALGGHLPTIYLEGQYRIPDSSISGTTIPDYYGAIIAQFPLFSGGMVHSLYLTAKSQERQAELRYNEILRTAREEFNYFVRSWHAGENQLEKLKTAKENADGAYKTILADYRVGQATNLEVLSALDNQVSAREQFEKTRLNQKLIIIHIKILAGELP